jgi:SAM-dependent methyltransferase
VAAVSVDWGAGNYERTAAELEPVAAELVARAAPGSDERVLDLACGTGNVALLAARRGAHVIGVDGAPRLLDVARSLAARAGLELDLRQGDLLALPVDDASVDTVISCFGIIFAADPARALAEVARVLTPGGRALVSAWVPAGPIDAMLSAMGRVIARAAPERPRPRFAWSDPAVVGPAATGAGLTLTATTPSQLEIRAASPEAYVEAGQDHPMALATRDRVQSAGIGEEIRAAMIDALRAGNEDPSGLLVHSPFVIHELRVS